MLATGAGTTGWDGTYMMNVMEPLEFPVLNPWRPVEIPGPGEFLFERNPYYYKIDTAGNQLPYIDYIRKSTAEDQPKSSPNVVGGRGQGREGRESGEWDGPQRCGVVQREEFAARPVNNAAQAPQQAGQSQLRTQQGRLPARGGACGWYR